MPSNARKNARQTQLFCFVKQINGRLIGFSVFHPALFCVLCYTYAWSSQQLGKSPRMQSQSNPLNASENVIFTTDIYMTVRIVHDVHCTLHIRCMAELCTLSDSLPCWISSINCNYLSLLRLPNANSAPSAKLNYSSIYRSFVMAQHTLSRSAVILRNGTVALFCD